MSNSSLITGTMLSPNRNAPKNHKIDKITIHHFAVVANVGGAVSVAKAFQNPARQCSANYIVDDNEIILCVDEANRAWTSSNAANDNRAVTLEIANDGNASTGWHVSDKTLKNTINLVVDICKRNGIKKLVFTGDANGNLTFHRMFKNTTCPGSYIESKAGYIVDSVNAKLGGGTPVVPTPPPSATYPTLETAEAHDLFAKIRAGTWNKRSTPEKTNNIIGQTSNGGTFYIQTLASGWAYLPALGCWIVPEAYITVRPAHNSSTGKKSNEDIAREVIRGEWGNGAEREKRLAKAGYDYAAVQKIVNTMV